MFALAVPEIPGRESRKPLIVGAACRLGSGVLSCEALFAADVIPSQTLAAHLHLRGRPPTIVMIEWSAVEPGVLHKNVVIDLVKGDS